MGTQNLEGVEIGSSNLPVPISKNDEVIFEALQRLNDGEEGKLLSNSMNLIGGFTSILISIIIGTSILNELKKQI